MEGVLSDGCEAEAERVNMTRPAPITRADLARYPHLRDAINQAQQQGPAPALVPQGERAAIVIPVPGLPGLPDPERMEHGVYGFVVGVVFMGILGILGRMM